MPSILIPPAKASILGLPVAILAFLIMIAGVSVFTYLIARRLAPLVRAQSDPRLDRIFQRLYKLLKLWLGQNRHPRYPIAGILHILLFAGFLMLSIRSIEMVVVGFYEGYTFPGFGGILGGYYHFIKSYAATMVLIVVCIAAYRRGIAKPKRYNVPAQYGKAHTFEALLVLFFIAILMISETLFDAIPLVAGDKAQAAAPFSLIWVFSNLLAGASSRQLQGVYLGSYLIHDLIFFFFLCFLPLGKHFHVITSLFNVFCMRLDKGNIKPVKYGISDAKLDELDRFGIKKLEDFTWKQLLDFYSCADCGRCSDNCPANAVGRPLSPRFISIKGRDCIFKNYPLSGKIYGGEDLIGSIYSEDEIWSCTTCGACEQECPLGIEYIDKIVDLRRFMIEEGNVPQSLQKPLRALEKRGNPWGKMEKKRSAWTKEKAFKQEVPVNLLEGRQHAETLYFVDSITSYDDRMQEIGRATARLLSAMGIDFGILGKLERDSGNEVRRFGEEMLFQDLKERNSDAILNCGAQRIITSDPHAFNALKNEYTDLPPVVHISQVIVDSIAAGKLRLKPLDEADKDKVYTYHDPCYLGRHNDLYDAPRAAIDAIYGIQRVEMDRCRDRSFCCGGGGLMLFYEPEEEQRMGVLRVEMAQAAGASVIVSACPFCLLNIEDAIKVSGMEGKMEAVDLSELVARHIVT